MSFRPSSFNFLPLAIKNLLIVNGLFFLATLAFGAAFQINLVEILGLPYFTAPNFKWYQVVTHVFMHGGFFHLFSNMFALWMFGTALENAWGPKRFLFYYFFTAFGAVVLFELVKTIEYYRVEQALQYFQADPTVTNLQTVVNRLNLPTGTTFYTDLVSLYGRSNGTLDAEGVTRSVDNILTALKSVPTVGASGAVFGVLIAFAMYYPNSEIIFLFLPFPIKAKYFVAIYGLMELYLGIQNNPSDPVAHFAHLGGLLFGFILVKYWNKTNRKTFY